MRIDERLNLIVPLYGDVDTIIGYVHSTPISRAAFEMNYKLTSLTFSAIFSMGFGELGGPRVASLIMKDIAAAQNLDAEALMNEIKRLSNWVRPGINGWEMVPLAEAIARNQIDADDQAEVLNALVFFTVASAMWPRRRSLDLMPGVAKLWGAETSSLPPMEWIASLPISTVTAVSGGMAPLTTSVQVTPLPRNAATPIVNIRTSA